MRKVLSIVLVLALVLGSVSMAFAAPMSDVKGGKYEDAVNVLTELGVVNGYPDGTYKPANIVTRGEMAKIVICALGLDDYAAGSSSFSDMAGHWADKYVAYAVSLGIINGYPDGTFKPDNTVSYDEAAKMLVAALGYTEDALIGSWPANWIVKARALDILDGVKAGSAGANRGDIALMAFQTLDNELGYVNKDGEWVANKPSETMLDRLGAELFNPTGVPGDEGEPFVVTDTHADQAIANIREYIGAYVTAYANDGDIIAIKEVKSTFLTGKINAAGDEFKADDVTYDLVGGAYYDANATTEELLIANGVSGNGVDIATDMAVVATEYTIAADISGKKIKNIYSVGVWTLGPNFQFEKDMLEDDNLNGNDFVLDDNDDIDLSSFALLGVDNLESIKDDDVVYVYMAAGKVARIEVGTEVVEGEVTRINSDGSKVTVGGKAYEVSAAANANAADWATLKLEDEVTFYLDYDGKVFEVEIAKAKADNYAILLETANGKTGLGGSDGLIKLVLADGTVKTFVIDEDLDVAGVVGPSSGGVGAGKLIWHNVDYEGDAAAGEIVKYGVDKDGILDALTVYSPITTIETKSVTATKTEVTSKGYFNAEAVSSNVVVFEYDGARGDGNEASAKKYSVSTLADIKGVEYEDVDYLYDNTNKQIVAMLIIGAGAGGDEVYGLVTGWYQTTASSTDYMISILVDGKEVEYEMTSSLKTTVAGWTAGTEEKLLYLVEFTSGNAADKLVEVDGINPTDADILEDNQAIDTAYAKGVVEVNGTEYTVDKDAVLYKWDTDEFVKKANKDNLAATVVVSLYDLDDDGVVDIILIP